MRPIQGSIVPCLVLACSLVACCRADTVATLDVNVRNSPSPLPVQIPQTGTYTLSFRGHQACVVAPDGSIKLVDFDAKLISVLDPIQKSFYQMPIDAYLAYGDKLSPQVSGSSVRSTVTFAPMQGQDSRQILDHKAMPFDLDLEDHLARKSSGSRGGGRRHGGILGGIGGGGSSDSSDMGGQQPSSGGVKVSGEVWMTDTAPPNVDPDEFSLAELVAMMPFGPGIKELDTRVHRAKSAILAASFSISMLDRNGGDQTSPPSVVAELKSLSPSSVDAGLFRIPADYAKSSPPAPYLGLAQ
jgi:hypothetical protein